VAHRLPPPLHLADWWQIAGWLRWLVFGLLGGASLHGADEFLEDLGELIVGHETGQIDLDATVIEVGLPVELPSQRQSRTIYVARRAPAVGDENVITRDQANSRLDSK